MSLHSKLLFNQVNQSPFIAQSPPSQSRPRSSIDLGGLLNQFNNPEGLFTLGGLIFILVLLRFAGTGKGKITTGKVCGTAEKLTATQLSLKQIKERKPNQVTLWCGSPRYWWNGKQLRGVVSTLQTLLGAMPTVWLPHAERSILVIGAPGSGKTFSTIDPALESAMIQGFPIVLYDKKGSQMQLHVPLAARYGYKVRVFAPGEPYSSVINPLDFMKDEEDAVMAGEIGQVINRNASSAQGKTDEFFSKAGDLLAQALLQLVKESRYPDMQKC